MVATLIVLILSLILILIALVLILILVSVALILVPVISSFALITSICSGSYSDCSNVLILIDIMHLTFSYTLVINDIVQSTLLEFGICGS